MSQRRVAQVLGVSRTTIQRDEAHSGPESGPKRATPAERRVALKLPKSGKKVATPSERREAAA
jgi:hypothetical protein